MKRIKKVKSSAVVYDSLRDTSKWPSMEITRERLRWGIKDKIVYRVGKGDRKKF